MITSLQDRLKRRTSAAKAAPVRTTFSARLEAVPFVQDFSATSLAAEGLSVRGKISAICAGNSAEPTQTHVE